MKLALTLDKGSSDSSFRPRDRVQGVAEILGHASKRIPEVKAIFRGQLIVGVSTQSNSCCPGKFMRMLFEHTEDLQRASTALSKSSLEHHALTYPFEFQFPTNSPCRTNQNFCLGQLPSSIDVVQSGVHIRAVYSITIIATRRVCRMRRTTSITRELPFSCDPHLTFMPSSCTASLPASKLCKDYDTVSDSSRDAPCQDSLPSYCPSLRIEMSLPRHPVLIRGQATQVSLMIHVPQELLRDRDIYVRSVEIKLHTCVTAHLGLRTQHVEKTRRGCNLTGTILVDSEHFDLDMGPWGSFLIVNAKPTCTSHAFRVAHSIEVVAGISKGLSEETQYVQSSMEVLIMDPPPAYEPSNADVP